VRRHAVHAMEGEVLREIVEAEETLESRGFHLWSVGEAHVIVDESENLAGLVVGESEAAADVCSDGYAHFHVSVKSDAVRGFTVGGRLAHVMEKSTPGKCHRATGLELFKQHQSMDPDVTFRVELRRLLDAFHSGDFGKDLDKEIGFVEELECSARVTFCEHFGQFFTDTLTAYGMDARGELADCGEGGGFDGEAETGSKADRAKEAEVVFFETLFGSTNGADYAGIEIVEAANVIEQSCANGGRLLIWRGIGEMSRVEQQAVDREVAALDVFCGSFGIADFVGVAAVGINTIVSEGGDFGDHLGWGRRRQRCRRGVVS